MGWARVVTDEELERLPKDGRKYEIVDGEIVPLSPATLDHENLVARLIARLTAYVEAHRLGRVYGSNALFMIRGELRGRSPDLSFIGSAKLPPKYRAGSHLKVDTIPDLVVEVPSPSESKRALAGKVAEYLMAGIRAVWVVRLNQTATLYSPGIEPKDVSSEGELSDEDVLPGFSLRLGELFD